MSTIHMQQHGTRVESINGVSIILGLWLILAPYMFNYSSNGGSVANDIIVGLIVFFSSLVKPNWFLTLVGVWLIISPFVLGFPSGSTAMWNDIILGILVGGMSLMRPSNEMVDEDYDAS